MSSSQYVTRFAYLDITKDFKIEINKTNNVLIKKLYQDFRFCFFNFLEEFKNEMESRDMIEKHLFDFIFKNKFITVEISYINEKKLFPFELLSNPLDYSSDTVNATFCIENKCYFIRNISYEYLLTILNKTKSTFINVSLVSKFRTFQNVYENDLAIEEVENFYSYFDKTITKNIFIANSIRPVISFLVRRFFYPSYYFKNYSFFNLYSNNDSNEENLKTKFYNLLRSETFDKIEENKKYLSSFMKNKVAKKSKRIQYFSEKEFIKLRLIHGNDHSSIYLVFHLQNLHLFAMKITNKPAKHEVEFCKKHSHRCITHFYGFIIKNDQIIGFLYEFMSNGNLHKYISKNKNKINSLFINNTLIRLYQGINYLQSHFLIHRDLKPLNILIDHDEKVFISDFETIRSVLNTNKKEVNKEESQFTNDIGSIIYSSPEQISGNEVSLPTDIYSLGQIIYYLYEKQSPYLTFNPLTTINNKTNDIISDMTNCSNIIHKIYKKSVCHNCNERITIDQIKELLIEEEKSQNFFENYILINEFQINVIIQYFIEQIFFTKGEI